MMGMMTGNGIAGVASTAEESAIKVYLERDKYNEWEFLYDLTKDTKRTGAAMMNPGMQPGVNPQTGTQGTTPAGPFGTQPTGTQPTGPFGTQPPPFGAPPGMPGPQPTGPFSPQPTAPQPAPNPRTR
jgi:hypothetical protein